jgi:hypothetical protein
MMRKLINRLPPTSLKSRELTNKRESLSNNKPLKVLKSQLLLSLNHSPKEEKKISRKSKITELLPHLAPKNLDKATILIEEVEPEECKYLLM